MKRSTFLLMIFLILATTVFLCVHYSGKGKVRDLEKNKNAGVLDIHLHPEDTSSVEFFGEYAIRDSKYVVKPIGGTLDYRGNLGLWGAIPMYEPGTPIPKDVKFTSGRVISIENENHSDRNIYYYEVTLLIGQDSELKVPIYVVPRKIKVTAKHRNAGRTIIDGVSYGMGHLLDTDTGTFSMILGDSTLYSKDTMPGIQGRLGSFNVCIGKDAGSFLSRESYCVIVGHDSTAVTLRGKDMLWYVDFNEPALLDRPMIKILLEHYDQNYVAKGNDSKDNRLKLIHLILATVNSR
jgi:hypothetical protein